MDGLLQKKLWRDVRWGRVLLALTGLACVYLFQRVTLMSIIENLAAIDLGLRPNTVFVVNKTARLIVNDLLSILLISGLFSGPGYTRVAWYVFILELFIILPLYFFFKLSAEGDSEISSPLFAQIHRLVVNPMLMFLLAFSFAFQRLKSH